MTSTRNESLYNCAQYSQQGRNIPFISLHDYICFQGYRTNMKISASKKLIFAAMISLSLFAVAVFAASVFKSPTACNGRWTNCNNAFSDNSARAYTTATNTVNKSGIWKNYDISIPADATVDSVIVRADFFASNFRGYINVRASGDGGQTYGPPHTVGGNTAEQTYLIDVTSDVAWDANKLNKTNLVVNVTCFKSQTGTNPTCRLDWIPVNVTYTPAVEFNFSVSASPASATINQSRSANTTVTVTLLSGATQNVDLSYAGCPASSTCSFNPASGNPTYASTFTVQTSPTTPTGTRVINITGTGDGKTRTAQYTLTVTDSPVVVDIQAVPKNGTAPLQVNFTSNVQIGNAPFTYIWNFGDSFNSTAQNPQHTFNSTGTYNTTLVVTDYDGDYGENSVIINVF